MATNQQPLIITVNNRFQDLGDLPPDRANALGNLSVEKPTIEQVNAALTGGSGTSNREDNPEPAFGEHIREAAGAVRRILR